MSNDRHSRPTARNDSLPASTVMGGKHVGPVFHALIPPQEVSPWIAWKIASTGVGIARRLWDQREQLRGKYEDVHGTGRALWPTQHPEVVLDAVPSFAHGACLGCQWFDVRGHWVGHSDWFERAPTHIVKCCYYPRVAVEPPCPATNSVAADRSADSALYGPCPALWASVHACNPVRRACAPLMVATFCHPDGGSTNIRHLV